MNLHEGNLFFKHKYPTIDIERMVDHFDSFDAFEKCFSDELMDENLLMADFLYKLFEDKGYAASNVSQGIGLSPSYVGKIISGDKKNPTRDVLLAICVYIGASVEQTQILLRYSGKAPLYARRKRDMIIWYGLKRKMSLLDVDNILEARKFKILYKSQN